MIIESFWWIKMCVWTCWRQQKLVSVDWIHLQIWWEPQPLFQHLYSRVMSLIVYFTDLCLPTTECILLDFQERWIIILLQCWTLINLYRWQQCINERLIKYDQWVYSKVMKGHLKVTLTGSNGSWMLRKLQAFVKNRVSLMPILPLSFWILRNSPSWHRSRLTGWLLMI